MFKKNQRNRYKLELQNVWNNKIIWQRKKRNRKNKKCRKCTEFDVVEVILDQWNLADNQNQQKSEVLYTFKPNESYGYLLNVEPSNLIFLKPYNTEFDETIITFTDQNGRLIEIDKLNLKLSY